MKREDVNNKKDKDKKKERIERRLNTYRKEVGKDNIKDLTLEELENFVKKYYKSSNRIGFYNQISILNEILIENNNKNMIDSRKLVNECVKFNEDKYFTKPEVIDLCNSLTNYQDKFIIYALFSGIVGKNCDDLLSIKTKDIATDCSYIKVNGKVFFTDDTLKKYTRELIKEKVYIRETSKGDFPVELNMDNPYLIKLMPNKKNDALNKMPLSTLHGKLSKLTNLLLEEGFNVKLTVSSLYYSGIMFKMFEKEIDENVEWSIEKLDQYLKMNDYYINPIELYRKYYNKYHGTNSIVEL